MPRSNRSQPQWIGSLLAGLLVLWTPASSGTTLVANAYIDLSSFAVMTYGFGNAPAPIFSWTSSLSPSGSAFVASPNAYQEYGGSYYGSGSAVSNANFAMPQFQAAIPGSNATGSLNLSSAASLSTLLSGVPLATCPSPCASWGIASAMGNLDLFRSFTVNGPGVVTFSLPASVFVSVAGYDGSLAGGSVNAMASLNGWYDTGNHGGSGYERFSVNRSVEIGNGSQSSSGTLEVTIAFASAVSGEVRLSENVDAFLPISPVPEASEWVMMLCGLGMVGAVARRRRLRCGAPTPTRRDVDG